MKHQVKGIVAACLALGLMAQAQPRPQTEAPSAYAAPVRIAAWALPAPASAKIVEDPQASDGKALELYGEQKKPLSDPITINLPNAERAGRYVLRVRAKATGLYDLGRAWRVEVKAGDEVLGWAVLHGYQFKGSERYRDVLGHGRCVEARASA
jgi:hypothetical protein